MATLNFYLKSANKNNLYPVMLCYQDKGKKFRYFTKIQVSRGQWKGDRIKAVSLADFENNEKLKELEEIIQSIERNALTLGIKYSIDQVETQFRKLVASKQAVPAQSVQTSQGDFFDLYDQFVERSRATKAKSTIADYKMCKSNLLAFQARQGRPVTFETINGKFYDEFMNYMLIHKRYLNNTVGSRVKNLKVFLNYAVRNELTNRTFNFKDFKTINEEVDIVALSEIELFKIFRLDNLTTSQEIARDYLCFECFTGLRFSDIGNLTNENIKSDFIVLKTKKTRDTLYIPINIFTREILNKYADKYNNKPLPPPMPNQVVNRLIKEVAKGAGVTEVIQVEKFNGANRIAIKKPKCDFISTHTGRRTFISLSYEKGMQTEMIMKITGIKKWETLKRYLKVSEKSKLIKMNEFWNNEVMKLGLTYKIDKK